MATLKILEVGGIRSFGADDNDRQVITFEKPFTLILGRNGCGKTTIIEALKFACTGTFPAGQGVVFVRDPKIDGVTETRAHVKLQFQNSRGQNVTVCKLMSSTQKLKTLQYKTLEVSTSVEDNGKAVQLSNRCLDAEAFICKMLGVSKPILSYVIFCHQEESHWPLDEGKKLKERFDEIFDSTRYNKCMDTIRKVRNTVLSDIKIANEALKHLQQNVDVVKQKRGELQQYNERLEATKVQLESYRNDKLLCEEQSKVWQKKAEDYMKLREEKESAKNKLDKLLNEQDVLQKVIIHVFSGSEDELKQKIKQFEEQLSSQVDARREIEKSRMKVDEVEKETRRAISDLTIRTGNLETEKKHEIKAKEERNLKLSKLSQVLGLDALKDGASESDISDVMGNVRKQVQSLVIAINSLKRSQNEEERNLQGRIDKCLEEKTNLETEIRIKDEAVSANDNEMINLRNKLKKVHLNLEKREEIVRSLQKCQEDRENAGKGEDKQALAAEIQKLRTACSDMEDRHNQLTSEIRNLIEFQDIQNKLKMFQEKFDEHQAMVSKIRSKNCDFISKYLENSSDGTMKYDLEMLIRKWKMELEELQNQVSRKERDESSFEQQRKSIKAQLDKKKSELAQNKESLYQLCGKKKLDDVLDEVNRTITEIQDEKGLMQSSKVVYTNYIKRLEESNPCCPLCNRGFDNDLDPQELVAELNSKISVFPGFVDKLADKLKPLQKKQCDLLALKPVERATIHLETNEIPQFEQEMSVMEERLEEARQELPLLVAEKQEVQNNLKSATDIQGDIFEIDRCHKDSKRLTKQIEDLKRVLPLSTSSRTSDQAVAEQQVLQQDLSLRRKEKEDLEERLRAYDKRLNDLDQKINTLTARKLEIETQVREEKNIKTRLEELSSLKIALEAELIDLKQKQDPIRQKHMEAVVAFKTTREKNDKARQEKDKEREDREMEMRSVMELQNKIRSFESKNIEESLQKLKLKHEDLKRKLEELKSEKDGLIKQSNDLTELINGHERRTKELEENLRLIRVVEEIERQKVVCAEFQEKLGDMKVRDIQNKCQEYNTQLTRLNREMDQLTGEISGLKDNIRSREKELNDGYLKNAEKKYIEKLVFCKVKTLVEKDLQKYYGALDYAMQHFHKDKMAAINKIIREYWKLIYKGNDIDYIEIKTDENFAANSASNAPEKKKVYNYRVVQVKHGTEIEMRGRCSAGQKVLACLIIRMALAETFSATCGILTLDEPTTNLDKQNIESLCQAITDIIHTANKGFQLIVITHDVQFLRAMSHSEDFEHYYEITRNHRSKSEIRQRPVMKE